jgi:hypothetical protein
MDWYFGEAKGQLNDLTIGHHDFPLQNGNYRLQVASAGRPMNPKEIGGGRDQRWKNTTRDHTWRDETRHSTSRVWYQRQKKGTHT